MYEKISQMYIRKEKIKKLKSKILTEIDEYNKKLQENMKRYLLNKKNNLSIWDYMITEEFSLLRLKEFIENPESFQSVEKRYDDKDIIIYRVPDENLNIWLQENYNFVFNFLCKISYEGFCDVYDVLNDNFFGCDFINIGTRFAIK